MLSLLLGHFHSPNCLGFTGFVGLNLFQSGFTQFCPLFNILAKMGFPVFLDQCNLSQAKDLLKKVQLWIKTNISSVIYL